MWRNPLNGAAILAAPRLKRLCSGVSLAPHSRPAMESGLAESAVSPRDACAPIPRQQCNTDQGARDTRVDSRPSSWGQGLPAFLARFERDPSQEAALAN